MAHIWHRRAGSSEPQQPVAAVESDSTTLRFSISHGDPLAMTFTQKGGDMVYKASTSSHVTTISCTVGGQPRAVGKIHWNHYDPDTIMVEFTDQDAIHLEKFLRMVNLEGFEHQFTAKDRILHGAFAKDHFVLTDPNDALVGHDNRVPTGLLRRATPDSFEVSAELSDVLDYVFVAYLCMERARRERSAGVQSRAYSEAWQTSSPGMLGLQGPP